MVQVDLRLVTSNCLNALKNNCSQNQEAKGAEFFGYIKYLMLPRLSTGNAGDSKRSKYFVRELIDLKRLLHGTDTIGFDRLLENI